MKIWFSDPTNGQYAGEANITERSLFKTWRLWQDGLITSFRINVTIGRYPRSVRIEHLLAQRTFRKLIEETFLDSPADRPVGEMASWPPEAA